MSKTTDYATNPPHMPRVYQFARQEKEIKRLTEENKALLLWAQAAYTRLQSLMTIGVSLTPDAVTTKLLEDAPEVIRLPTVAELAADLGVSERELVEYALYSVGAPDSAKGGAQ